MRFCRRGIREFFTMSLFLGLIILVQITSKSSWYSFSSILRIILFKILVLTRMPLFCLHNFYCIISTKSFISLERGKLWRIQFLAGLRGKCQICYIEIWILVLFRCLFVYSSYARTFLSYALSQVVQDLTLYS